jgi:hypothetical protein
MNSSTSQSGGVGNLCGVVVSGESFEGEWTADHVAAEAGSTLPALDPHGAVDREAAVAPGEEITNRLLSDETLAHGHPQHFGAEEAFDLAGVIPTRPLGLPVAARGW